MALLSVALIHPETPTALTEYHNHENLGSLAAFGDEHKVRKNELNDWISRIKAMTEAQRANAILTGKAPSTSGVKIAQAFKYLATTSGGIHEVSTSLAADLDRQFASAMAIIDHDLSETDVLSASFFFAAPHGGLTLSTTFAAGALLNLATNGTLVTHAAGAHPPVGHMETVSFAKIDLAGRTRADAATLQYNASGALEIKTGAAVTFGAVCFSGTLTVKAKFEGIPSLPTQILASQVNLDSTDTMNLAIFSDAAYNIRGIDDGSNGRFLFITNIGAFDLTFKHEDAAAVAANRITTSTGGDFVLGPGETGRFIYFDNIFRWRVTVSTAASPTTTKGDLLVRDATADQRFPVGTNGQYIVADSGEALGVKYKTLFQDNTKTIENPGASEKLPLWGRTKNAMTLQEVNFLLVSGAGVPSMTPQLRHATNFKATGTQILSAVLTNTTSGQVITSFDDATIPASSYIWAQNSASNNVKSVTVGRHWTEDA